MSALLGGLFGGGGQQEMQTSVQEMPQFSNAALDYMNALAAQRVFAASPFLGSPWRAADYLKSYQSTPNMVPQLDQLMLAFNQQQQQQQPTATQPNQAQTEQQQQQPSGAYGNPSWSQPGYMADFQQFNPLQGMMQQQNPVAWATNLMTTLAALQPGIMQQMQNTQQQQQPQNQNPEQQQQPNSGGG